MRRSGAAGRRFFARGWAAAAGLAALAGAGALAAAGLAGGDLAVAHADDDSTSKDIWMLGFEHGRPQRILVGRSPYVQRYWYLPFTLTNQDDRDHSIFIEVTAESDKDVRYRALDEPAVLERVRARLGLRPGQRLWSNADLTTAHAEQEMPAGDPIELALPKIPAGATVQCVAIFEGPDNEADHIKIRIRGLTNDVEIVDSGRPHERVLKTRVLVLEYSRPGDEFHTQEDPIEYVGRSWETVEETIKTDLE